MNNNRKFHEVLNSAKDYSIAFLQETKLQVQKIAEIRSKWRNHEGVFMSCAREGSRRGVVTLFSDKIDVTHIEHHSDEEGQFIVNICRIQQRIMMLANVYGSPDTDQNAEATFARLTRVTEDLMNKYNAEDIVMAGDFNVTLNRADTNTTSNKPRAEGRLRSIILDLDIVDADPVLNMDPNHTYFCAYRENRSARYDRFYISPHLLFDAKIKRKPRIDDHTPLVLELKEIRTHGNSWRFDDKLLEDASFLQKIQNVIRETMVGFSEEDLTEVPLNDIQNQIRRQEPFKIIVEVIRKVIQLSKKEMKELKEARKEKYEDKLKKMIEARDMYNTANPPTEDDQERFEDAQQEYRAEQGRRADMAAVANHNNYATHGEKLSHYHFAMMKPGKAAREIQQLVINGNGGSRNLEGSEIIRHMTEKYEEISKKDLNIGGTSIEQFLGEALVQTSKQCPLEMEPGLCQEITADEMERVVNDLKERSAPGPMGITNMLLKFLFPTIKHVLADAGNRWLLDDNPQHPPAGLLHRKVIFIKKAGRDARSDDSYRGLSMLENIYKLYSKVLANRLAPALKHVQDRMQFGFTRGTGCREASRTVIDAVHEAAQKNIPLININTDVFKAFDTIDRQHIYNCLEFYAFPQKMIEAYRRLTQNSTVEFEINRETLRQVALERGTGQGDPSSSFLFNLAVTPLNHFLTNSSLVPRIKFGNIEVPPVYFADDNNLPLDGTQPQRIKDTLNKIIEYEQVSGLKLNMTKCEVMPVKCDQNVIDDLIQATGMRLVNKTKHLGIWIDENGNIQAEDNIKPIKEKLDKLVNTYSTSLSTPLGRSLYAKYILSSRYIHVTMNRILEDEEARKLKKSLTQMTWTKNGGNQPPSHRVHIAKDRIAQKPKFGGLGVPDPATQNKALRLAWVRNILQGAQDQIWYIRLAQWLRDKDRPSPEQHLQMGQNEWRTTAEAIRESSQYWASVFEAIAVIIEATNAVHKQWHLFPIIGSSRSMENNIGSLTYGNPQARQLMMNGLVNIGQVFRTNEAGHIMHNSMKTMAEIQTEYNINISYMLMNSIASLVRDIKQKYRREIHRCTQPQSQSSPLKELIKKYPKGCSAATEVLLAKQRQGWGWGDCPRSYSTYRQDGYIDITQAQFSLAFTKVRKSLTMPAAQWTTKQILLRTLWTAKKEANTQRGMAAGEDGNCKNCLEDSEEDTAHLMFDCPVTKELLEWVYRSINQAGSEESPGPQSPYPLIMNKYQVLFHKIPRQVSRAHMRDIDDILMIVKHVLYRMRMREDSNRRPTRRGVAMRFLIEYEKHIKVMEYNGKPTQFLKKTNEILCNIAGWQRDN